MESSTPPEEGSPASLLVERFRNAGPRVAVVVAAVCGALRFHQADLLDAVLCGALGWGVVIVLWLGGARACGLILGDGADSVSRPEAELPKQEA